MRRSGPRGSFIPTGGGLAASAAFMKTAAAWAMFSALRLGHVLDPGIVTKHRHPPRCHRRPAAGMVAGRFLSIGRPPSPAGGIIGGIGEILFAQIRAFHGFTAVVPASLAHQYPNPSRPRLGFLVFRGRRCRKPRSPAWRTRPACRIRVAAKTWLNAVPGDRPWGGRGGSPGPCPRPFPAASAGSCRLPRTRPPPACPCRGPLR